MDERVNRLIDTALERMRIESETRDRSVLELLSKIGRERNVLEKVASLVHLFSVFYRAARFEYVEFAEAVARCEPEAPRSVGEMVKWYPQFASDRRRAQMESDRAFQQMSQRLTKIQGAVRALSVNLPKINELERKNAKVESDLDSATAEVRRLKREVQEKERVIQDLSDRSQSSYDSADRMASEVIQACARRTQQLKSIETETEEGFLTILTRNREIERLKSELASLKATNETYDVTITNVKAIKQKYLSEYKEKEEKLVFEIEALKEKCIIMRKDLNHEIRRRRESEARALTLSDELQEKKVECHALQSRIDSLAQRSRSSDSSF